MPRKDFDVWDPPEDLNNKNNNPTTSNPPSAFLLHFQNRAVKVGKDGTNAQLVRVTQTKPLKWAENKEKKNNNNNKRRKETLSPSSLISQTGGVRQGKNTGILAPDEMYEKKEKELGKNIQQVPHLQNNNNNIIINKNINYINNRIGVVNTGNSNNSSESSNNISNSALGRIIGNIPDSNDNAGNFQDIKKKVKPPLSVIELSPNRTRQEIYLQEKNNNKVKDIPIRVGISSSSLSRPQPLNPFYLAHRNNNVNSPDVLIVDRNEEIIRPTEVLFPSSKVMLENIGVIQTIDGIQQPLARLPPRKIGPPVDLLMPKPIIVGKTNIMKVASSSSTNTSYLENNINNNKELIPLNVHNDILANRNINGNETPPLYYHNSLYCSNASSPLAADEEEEDYNYNNNDNSSPIPLYQPTGMMLKLSKMAAKGKNQPPITNDKKQTKNKKQITKNISSSSSANNNNHNHNGIKDFKRPSSEGISYNKINTLGKIENTNKDSHFKIVPTSNSLPYPSRLEPLSLSQQLRDNSEREHARNINNNNNINNRQTLIEIKEEDDDEDENEEKTKEKKPITYKSHNLKEYKILMEQIANNKRGGLGPADTDAQRQAREKMLRQRQYGELVEKQAIEKIREKNLQQQQQNEEEENNNNNNNNSPVKNKIQQPPPPERIQAKERRARALEYARNVPKPETSISRKANRNNNNSENNSSNENSPISDNYYKKRWRTPQEEAAWLREKRLMELEARHNIDRERVAAVKRQLGY